MMRIFNRKIHRNVAEDSVVEVTELDGIRQLHLGSKTVQSGMLVASPLVLVFNYSRAIMYFLLFSEHVKSVLTIGLGGGSVTKYIHGYCPDIKQTVVEINQQVIDIAKTHFFLPENDERLNVIKGDGIRYTGALNFGKSDLFIVNAVANVKNHRAANASDRQHSGGF